MCVCVVHNTYRGWATCGVTDQQIQRYIDTTEHRQWNCLNDKLKIPSKWNTSCYKKHIYYGYHVPSSKTYTDESLWLCLFPFNFDGAGAHPVCSAACCYHGCTTWDTCWNPVLWSFLNFPRAYLTYAILFWQYRSSSCLHAITSARRGTHVEFQVTCRYFHLVSLKKSKYWKNTGHSWRINGVSWIFQELISHMVPRLFNTYLDEVLEWRSFFFHSSEIWCVSLIDFLFSSSFLWNPLDAILVEIGKVRVWSPPTNNQRGPKEVVKVF